MAASDQLLYPDFALPDGNEFDFVVLKAQLKYDFGENVFLHTKHYKIERADVETDIRYLESAERDFWKQVQERKRPALILPEL